MTAYNLDLRNLLCPMPVIKTQNKVKELSSGDILEVTCTDPGAKADISSWCRINGHEVLDIQEDKRNITIILRV